MGKTFRVRTKPWKITLLVLFAFVVFLLIWLLIGDVDLLKQEYLVPVEGVVWKGTITHDNVQHIADQYFKYANYSNASDFAQYLADNWMDKECQIRNISDKLYFNAELWGWLCGGLALTALLPIILRLCKQVNWDVLPFSYAMTLAGFVWVISGAIPQSSFKDSKQVWLWVIRILIMFATFAAFFFSINAIVVAAMAKSKYASQYINQLQVDKKADDIAKKESKEVIDAYIKRREETAVTYIEVEEEIKDKDKKKKK